MRLLGREQILFFLGRKDFAVQDGRQSQCAQADAAVTEKLPARAVKQEFVVEIHSLDTILKLQRIRWEYDFDILADTIENNN
jgi:hypothetical protein